jgi:hypothetical protein
MVKHKLLMIAYHYPPLKGSSGIQRTLKFSRYLTELDWEVSVISAHPRAYPQISDEQMNEIPADVNVVRAFALDTARHLAIAGRYPGLFAWPDRWSSWCFGILVSGLCEVRKNRPDIIWSTYPIASAHLGAYLLHKLTGIPWVADFRDSMTEENYPQDKNLRCIYRWIEARTVNNAKAVVFTTPGAVRMYAERYPHLPSGKWRIISNGFDEENFSSISDKTDTQAAGPLTLVHSGLLYPSERDPGHFFDALSELKNENAIDAGQLQIILRATGYDDYFQPLLEARNIQDIVKLAPSISYQNALREMITTQGLLLFQASNCNHQIPAKLYEYIRARKPIFVLTDHTGDTAAVLREVGINTLAPLDNKEAIKSAFHLFLMQLKNNEAPVADEDCVSRFSRRSLTRSLSDLLINII